MAFIQVETEEELDEDVSALYLKGFEKEKYIRFKVNLM